MNSADPGFLLHKVGAMMERISETVLFDQLGIGYSQFKLLYVLDQKSGIQQKEIAMRLGQTEASISRQIKILVKDGLVAVEQSKQDRKKHIVSLTRRGSETSVQAFTLLNRFYGPILSCLDAREQQQLASILSTLSDRLAGTSEVLIKNNK